MQELMDLRRLDELESRSQSSITATNPQTTQSDQSPQTNGILSRIGQDYSQRMSGAQGIANDVVNEKMSPVSGVLQGVGQAAGLGTDIVTEAAKTAAEGAKNYLNIFHPDVMPAVNNVAGQIANSSAGQFTGEQVKNAVEAYHGLKQSHPEAVGNLEALANIGMSLPAIKSVTSPISSVVGDTVKGVTNVIKDPLAALDTATSSEAPTVLNTSSQDKTVASKWYKKVEKSGEVLSNNTSQLLSDNLDALKPTDAGRAAVWEKSGIQNHIDIIKNAMKNGPLTFDGASALRSDLNSELKVAYRAGDDTKAMHLEQIKKVLTDAMKGPENASFSWQMANHEFAKGGAKEDLELLVAKAEGKAQPANSLDTAINGLLNNSNASAGLRLNEKNALRQVTQKTGKGELLKSAGTRLLSTAGASVGGVPGFLIGHYGSMFARDAAMTSKLQKLDKVYELISNRTPPVQIGPWDKTGVK